ncbi:MAG TPA: transporter substrate-binding domain-containing protein, partial [Aliiroseovarius sp.]|nr:transporter substrate-binding domain-containing protein [Aliiroseovarius sp.]
MHLLARGFLVWCHDAPLYGHSMTKSAPQVQAFTLICDFATARRGVVRFIQKAWVLVTILVVISLRSAGAQEAPLVMATVERAPFSVTQDGALTGFSIDLMRAIAAESGREVSFEMQPSFPAMFEAVTSGQVDGAVANISITAERERTLDFTQPIFDAGLQIMVPVSDTASSSILSALLRWELAASVGIAFVFLLAGGMLMWWFERGRQEYFDRPAKEALFPSFWWALNLVVNGGFEERVATSRAGRVFSVFLVVASLFIVSVFVAQITTMMTVQAISGSIESINDLDGKRVATTEGSTASAFLDLRGVAHARMADLRQVLEAFEAGKLDAVVFDGPVLAYYVRTQGAGKARLVGRVFQREAYGIALNQGSPL